MSKTTPVGMIISLSALILENGIPYIVIAEDDPISRAAFTNVLIIHGSLTNSRIWHMHQ